MQIFEAILFPFERQSESWIKESHWNKDHEKGTANLQALLMSFLWKRYQTNARDETY